MSFCALFRIQCPSGAYPNTYNCFPKFNESLELGFTICQCSIIFDSEKWTSSQYTCTNGESLFPVSRVHIDAGVVMTRQFFEDEQTFRRVGKSLAAKAVNLKCANLFSKDIKKPKECSFERN